MRKKEEDRIEMYRRIRKHGEDLIQYFNIPPDTDKPGFAFSFPVRLCRRLRTLEARAHRYAERLCNGPEIPEAEVEKIEKSIDLALVRIIGKEGAAKCFINTDPRGYALKICEERSKFWQGYKDWGGYGIIAPDFR